MKKNNSVSARNEIVNSFYKISDGAKDPEIRGILRKIAEEVLHDRSGPMSPEKEAELQSLAQSIKEYVDLGLIKAVRNYRDQITLVLQRNDGIVQVKSKKEGFSIMAFLKKLFGKKSSDPIANIADKEAVKADMAINGATRDMESYSFKLTNEHAKYTEIVRKMAALDESHPDYKLLIIKATTSKKTIQALEDNMNRAFQVLLRNQEYVIRLGNYEMVRRYAAMLPDPSVAQPILDAIKDIEDEMDENMHELDKAFESTTSTRSFDFSLDASIKADIASVKSDNARMEEKRQEEALKKQVELEIEKRVAEERAERARKEAAQKAEAEAESLKNEQKTAETNETAVPAPEVTETPGV